MFFIGLLAFVAAVSADVYMHNPRGANCRWNEPNNRQNANRLYDTQNNAAGGYQVAPPMSYVEGSFLQVEWTAQHGCGSDRLHCQFVLQYMCGATDGPVEEMIRDGQTTDRIPDDASTFNMMATDPLTNEMGYYYGMHESYAYYQDCKTRQRNKGLFFADQEDAGRETAVFTRQDNNNNRHGFECPEERDYYPYWHPTPWRDIAILTDEANLQKMCKYYQTESQNVKGKGYCSLPAYNQEATCKSEGGTWSISPAWNLPAPECIKAEWNRDNHLGNTIGGYANTYWWKLPDQTQETCIQSDTCVCVFRLRYNISTADSDLYFNKMPKSFLDFQYNGANSPVKTDPYPVVAGNTLALALNTDQYGRTFQDRSHIFYIRPRPTNVPAAANIYNLNIRGKRGNIVQTYPAVEYDFVPQHLVVRTGDYIHVQWTGSNNVGNNGNNNAEGTDNTDRSNIVQLMSINSNTPLPDSDKDYDKHRIPPLFESATLRNRMAHLDQDQSQCKSKDQLEQDHPNDKDAQEEDPRNCMKLNFAERYFDGGVIRINRTSTYSYHYMSTRNNNFTNRSHKGSLTVLSSLPTVVIVFVALGAAGMLGAVGIGSAILCGKLQPHLNLPSMLRPN